MRNTRRWLPRLLLVGGLLAGLSAWADDLNVAVAANFFGTLQKLAPKFEQASGNKLLLSSGASGQLYTQIHQGAPFDVLLSADSERPKQLEDRRPGDRRQPLHLRHRHAGAVEPKARLSSIATAEVLRAVHFHASASRTEQRPVWQRRRNRC